MKESPAAEFIAAQARERAYQRENWTDPHDDRHTALEWGGLLARYVGRAVEAALAGQAELYRKALTVIASVAQAAYEADYRISSGFLKEPGAVLPPEGAPFRGFSIRSADRATEYTEPDSHGNVFEGGYVDVRFTFADDYDGKKMEVRMPRMVAEHSKKQLEQMKAQGIPFQFIVDGTTAREVATMEILS
jgi:hypothetical protein